MHVPTFDVSAARLESTVRHLASYPTRNSLSRYLAPACEWLADEYRSIPGCQVEIMPYVLPIGKRVTEPTPAVQVIATLPGERPEIAMMSAHIDSLNLSVAPGEGPAPGANDDASGVAATLEAARIMASLPRQNTVRFVAYSGEEQGLVGAKALAARAVAEGWSIHGVLNNDMVGSSQNLSGQSNPSAVRVFGEEGRSRELARIAEYRVRLALDQFRLKLVLRHDRFGRGGDHTPFDSAGFPAVRFTEVHEEYSRQHTPDDLPDAMDFEYLANVTRANLVTLFCLANTQGKPSNVRISLDQSHDGHLTWESTDAGPFEVFWRDTASSHWQGGVEVTGYEVTLPQVNKDDHFFAVASKNGVPVSAQ